MYFTIVITAILVNIDALFAGVALGINEKINLLYISVCAAIGFAMCLFAVFLSEILEIIFPFDLAIAGGILLILIGLRNIYILSKKDETKLKKSLLANYIAVGFSVGTDMTVAALSLSLILGQTLAIPIIFGLGQFMFVSLGIVLTNLKFFKFLKKYAWFSGAMLVVLGFVRFF